jgi:triacylglycerol lipase
MTARRLLIVLAIELALGLLLIRLAGASVLAALVLAPLFVLALDCAFIGLTFAISWPRGETVRRDGGAGLAKMIAGECLAYCGLFAVIQPFEFFFAGKSLPKPETAPILLLPGYMCNRGFWWWLGGRLREAGIFAEPINLEPPFDSIDDLADALHAVIKSKLKDAQADKLILVAHGMGGLAARAYLARHGASRVSKLITLACPHHGTRLAQFGFGPSAQEMKPGSEWLSQLAKGGALPIPVTNIWSLSDNFVAPQQSSRLEGSKEIILPRLGHLSFAFSQRVLELLRRELAD